MRRTGEIGLRMALGAPPAQVLRLVLSDPWRSSRWAPPSASAELFGLSPGDPLTYGAVAIAVAAIALVASLVPARRATQVNPLEALSTE